MTSPRPSTNGTPPLPDYLPIPDSAFGPALGEQGYFVGRVERNLFWVTDGTYQSAFLATPDGVVLFDAPPTIGHNLRRAVDEVVAAEGIAWRPLTSPRSPPARLSPSSSRSVSTSEPALRSTHD